MLFTDKGHHSPAVETMTAQHGENQSSGVSLQHVLQVLNDSKDAETSKISI